MADEKQYISRIKLANGTTAEIKDQEARVAIENIFAILTKTIVFNCGNATVDTDIDEIIFDCNEVE
jgi:hypothetical protein